ncbi:patatin-like phospholipase family protein [Xanthomonas nasturtii]|uniref:PNPLA domain-containing protein n=1 Tax=Xanthomonas nasturtii TaxID=1843581 RepID=A0A3E1KQK8_9XANT|nr:patatin-like phospholipase family protein [Xanthomonas nasturtii]MCL1531433.1 patatin-like phospholipase family protein [Xanthomonas nasturtii]MCL1563646.1 patatin-like phospholipase family protein [Xanthomonas nasturtii]MCL1568639.1 patatin-like phospholipase family protein [Xanthomonas nasturtii]MCL1572459.1 patatin-like phospholipase family protein [Xanthomonas nasturtii]MCL1581822.1 patatin-like phospholipase family protein [Xanthomonas nasturtii]
MTESQKIYVSFQGGGAKGVAHLGGLKALEDWIHEKSLGGIPHEISAVAGTSAGAIVAALVAVGYRADDIFSCKINSSGQKTGSHILEEVCDGRYKSPTSLFTERGWGNIKRIRAVLKELTDKFSLIKFIAAEFYINLIALSVSFVVLGFEWSAWVPVILLALPIFFFAILAIRFLKIKKGLASLDVIRDVINDAILKALEGRPVEHPDGVTFEDLRKCGCRSLKIVSTNVSTRDVEVFSYWTTANVSVADAVCASICLPIIFSPYEINIEKRGPQRFVDGGVLSNLPLWPFDDDRALSPEAWTLGFSLVREAGPSDKAEGGWIAGMISAVLSGPSSIHKRGIPGLIMVPVPTKLDLLDFDLSLSDYIAEVEKARLSCKRVLISSVSEQEVLDMLDVLRVALVDHLNGNDCDTKVSYEDFLFSIALRRPEHPSLLWPRFTLGYSGDELRERRLPFVRLAIKTGPEAEDRSPYPALMIQEESGERGWLINKGKWLVALELTLPETFTNEDGPPVLLIESANLTLDRLAAIMLGESGEEASKISGIVEVFEEMVDQFPQREEMSVAAVRTQLWK